MARERRDPGVDRKTEDWRAEIKIEGRERVSHLVLVAVVDRLSEQSFATMIKIGLFLSSAGPQL